jgi:superfamily I DNA/RNA helicase
MSDSPQLDEAQTLAAAHVSGPAVCLAGPGAGKTATIVCLVANLIRQGISPDRILCLTFSVAAATEMRLRIAKLLRMPEKRLADTISTFHSQALRLLNSEQRTLNLQDNPVLLPRDVLKALRQLFPSEDAKTLRQEFGKLRRSLVEPTSERMNYFEWDAWLSEQGLVDFDSMVYRAVKLLESNERVKNIWQNRFDQVIVDEAHDTDAAQARFAKIISAKTKNLFTVGDYSQRIYGWRGATDELLVPNGSKLYHLAANYRSTKEIVDAFRPFADEDAKELAEKMFAVRKESGKEIWQGFSSEEVQAWAVAEEIEKDKTSRTAVLSRTRALLAPIADALEDKMIRYVWNGKNFWAQREVKSVLAFAKLALVPGDLGALGAALMSPARCSRFLGAKFAKMVIFGGGLGANPQVGMNQLRRWEEFKSVVSSLKECRESSPHVFIRLIIQEAGFEPETDEEPDSFIEENLEALVRRAARFKTTEELIAHALKMEHEKSKDGVVLSTIHAAKGLEWSRVFVIGVSRDLLPHRRSVDWREEKRCLFVALSRARDFLWVSWHGEPSCFIEERIQRNGESKTADRQAP